MEGELTFVLCSPDILPVLLGVLAQDISGRLWEPGFRNEQRRHSFPHRNPVSGALKLSLCLRPRSTNTDNIGSPAVLLLGLVYATALHMAHGLTPHEI